MIVNLKMQLLIPQCQLPMYKQLNDWNKVISEFLKIIENFFIKIDMRNQKKIFFKIKYREIYVY